MNVSAFWILFGFGGLWLIAVGAISAWRRKHAGKPIVPRAPTSATFAEAWCSGRSLRNGITRIGGARNCLLVYVDDGELVVTPKFPFTLLFLPEIYGLDLRAPLKSISSVREDASLFGRTLKIDFSDEGPAPMELRLRDPEGFRSALLAPDATGNVAELRAPLRRRRVGVRSIFLRVFVGLWGVGAFYAGVSGLEEDYRYLRHGKEVIGVIDSHTGEVGSRSDSGVLSYQVNGQTFHLTSLRGNGVYKLGDTEKLLYIPEQEGQAREEDYLPFDVFWLVIGSAMILLAIFGRWLIRTLRRLL